MSDAYQFIAARQQAIHIESMLSYVIANNPNLSHEDAETIVVVAEYLQTNFPGIQHHSEPGWFTQRARELGKAVTDPDALQKHLDSRERIRNAPVERAYRQHKMKQWQDQMHKEIGHGVQRAKTTDEHAIDLAKSIFNRVKPRQSPQAPASPAETPDEAPEPSTPSPTVQAPQQAPSPPEDEDDGFDNSDQALKYLRGLGIKI